MRTNLILDPDVAECLERYMAEQGLSLDAAVNGALRQVFTQRIHPDAPPVPYVVETHRFGFNPDIDLNRLNQLADELEVEEFLRRQAG